MRVLVLGGTVFVGRAIAEHFRDAGHQVTCAARGASGEVPIKTVFKKIDRDDPSTLSAWTATSMSRSMRRGFVSSYSAYADQHTPGLSSGNSALLAPGPPDVDESDRETYGARKVACELAYRQTRSSAGPG